MGLSRRNFLATLAALPLAGKALDTLAAMAPTRDALLFNIDFPCRVVTSSRVPPGYIFGIDGKLWRKMQAQIREGAKTHFEEWADEREA